MTRKPTLQSLVLGELDPSRRRGGRGGAGPQERQRNRGAGSVTAIRGMTGNAQRVPQSVVKRVAAGGTHTRAELKRQLEYITRDEAMKASWSNFNGIERDLKDNTIDKTLPIWTSGWRGNPKRGHTDHIILSFPKGTDAETAEAVSREWGREIFGSGDYGDRWRYIAALHHNTEHVHTHFVIEKLGLDNDRFLSINRNAELNFDVMREAHARIAGEHGLALNATSRLSRGIIENPPRETDCRAAHAAGIPASQVPGQPLNADERQKREVAVHHFAQQYRNLGKLAVMADAQDGATAGGFMARLSDFFQSASIALAQGESLMATTREIERPAYDPTERLVTAQARLIETARETWADIQTMEPSAEKTALEVEFAERTREVRGMAINDPFLEAHSTAVDPANDPYRIPEIADLHSARAAAERDGQSVTPIDKALDEIRERLESEFSERESRLSAAGTSAAEVAERFMLAERTEGQITQWEDSLQLRGPHFNITNGVTGEVSEVRDPYEAGRIFASIDPAEKPEATLITGNGFASRSVGRTVETADGFDAYVIAPENFRDGSTPEANEAHTAFKAGFDGRDLTEDYSPERTAENRAAMTLDLKDDAARIIDDYEIPRDVQEMVARDQLLQAERYHRLADVPAIEAIVDRLNETLSQDDLERVRAGDATALLEEVKDPAIRAAVASELRNEAELGDQRHSESVEQYQQMARLDLTRSKSVEQDHEQEHEL